jgi:hypothetical protein
MFTRLPSSGSLVAAARGVRCGLAPLRRSAGRDRRTEVQVVNDPRAQDRSQVAEDLSRQRIELPLPQPVADFNDQTPAHQRHNSGVRGDFVSNRRAPGRARQVLGRYGVSRQLDFAQQGAGAFHAVRFRF